MMSMTNPKKTEAESTKQFYYNCQHCHWNTLAIEFKGDNLNSLLMKFNYYKGKYQRSPQHLMFDKLVELYKYNQDEHIKQEKFLLRSKKKVISYLNMQSKKTRIKYLWPQFLNDQKEDEERKIQS
jgi:hypothetical protein